MFFLFGWGNRYTKDFGETILQECSICSSQNHFKLLRATDWFDIFFIPVFPYSTKYYLICNHCENGIELEDDDQIETLKEMAKLIESFDDEGTSKKEVEKKYKALVKKLKGQK